MNSAIAISRHDEFNIGRTIHFYNQKNELIGTLMFDGKEMEFTGKAAESAQIFFDYVISIYKGRGNV